MNTSIRFAILSCRLSLSLVYWPPLPPAPKIELLQRAKVRFPSRSQKTRHKERKRLRRSNSITLREWQTGSHASSKSPAAHTFEATDVHSGGMFHQTVVTENTALSTGPVWQHWISCQFTGCSFGAAAILQYETLKLRVQSARDEEKAEKITQVRFKKSK